MDIQCVICKATFLRTSREKAYVPSIEYARDTFADSRMDSLNEHASNKHSKTVADCFPTFQGEAAK